jgi:hypothetical protein
MDLFDILTWAEILVRTTFLGTLSLSVPLDWLVHQIVAYKPRHVLLFTHCRVVASTECSAYNPCPIYASLQKFWNCNAHGEWLWKNDCLQNWQCVSGWWPNMGTKKDCLTPKLSNPSLPPSFLISKSVVFGKQHHKSIKHTLEAL